MVGTDLRIKHLAFRSQVFFSAGGSTHLEPCVSTEVEAHAKLPIDVQVSGHVHNGQIAPANLIVRTLYRLAYGYEEIGGRHFFVTSGYGFWGIPLRLGSQSEVWVIDVKGR